ncbi:MAG TPA: ATP phosphoribosyltransferase, partial [Actinomycetota bacterium]|nr:ATP phosphoribosyltransferase [Actinomycetota bacterium]
PKGSLEPLTLGLFEQADLSIRRGSDRDYHGTIDDPRIERVSILRPQEIPRYIEEGFFDIGITGLDWVEETESDVEVLSGLQYSGRAGGVAKIVLAVPREAAIERADQMPANSRISTEYPGITQRAFEKLGIPVRVFLSYGATEAKVPEIVDAVVEVTESGSTLRRAGLKIIEVLLESQTVLIANRAAAADPVKRQAMNDILMLLLGAMSARGRVLVKLNVSERDLASVLEILPAMKSPTISKLSAGDAYAVETVVEKTRINVLIPQLKERGASDIVELPISKIVP